MACQPTHPPPTSPGTLSKYQVQHDLLKKIRQENEWDCGVACGLMVLHAAGMTHITREDLLKALKTQVCCHLRQPSFSIVLSGRHCLNLTLLYHLLSLFFYLLLPYIECVVD